MTTVTLLLRNIIYGAAFLGLLHARNFLFVLVSFELLFLALFLLWVTFAAVHANSTGLLFGLFLLALVAVESAMRLSLYIALYKKLQQRVPVKVQPRTSTSLVSSAMSLPTRGTHPALLDPKMKTAQDVYDALEREVDAVYNTLEEAKREMHDDSDAIWEKAEAKVEAIKAKTKAETDVIADTFNKALAKNPTKVEYEDRIQADAEIKAINAKAETEIQAIKDKVKVEDNARFKAYEEVEQKAEDYAREIHKAMDKVDKHAQYLTGVKMIEDIQGSIIPTRYYSYSSFPEDCYCGRAYVAEWTCFCNMGSDDDYDDFANYVHEPILSWEQEYEKELDREWQRLSESSKQQVLRYMETLYNNTASITIRAEKEDYMEVAWSYPGMPNKHVHVYHCFPKFVYSIVYNTRGWVHMHLTPRKDWTQLVHILRHSSAIRMDGFVDLTAVDRLGNSQRYMLEYIFRSYHYNVNYRMSIALPEYAAQASLTSQFAARSWAEREVYDMFGIFFTNHPDLRRILTDYGFQGHPLQKNFPLSGYTEVFYMDRDKRIRLAPLALTQALNEKYAYKVAPSSAS